FWRALMKQNEIVNFIGGVGALLRDGFKRSQYQEVILPFTVLRRLDCVLKDSRVAVRIRQDELAGRVQGAELDRELRAASGFTFYNTSRWDFAALMAEKAEARVRLREYLAGFSPNLQQLLKCFEFERTLYRLEQSGSFLLVLERFASIGLHPNDIDNLVMGSVFEELIRKFNSVDDNPGEHFTPRDVAHLML